jgi:hypothetical protein
MKTLNVSFFIKVYMSQLPTTYFVIDFLISFDSCINHTYSSIHPHHTPQRILSGWTVPVQFPSLDQNENLQFKIIAVYNSTYLWSILTSNILQHLWTWPKILEIPSTPWCTAALGWAEQVAELSQIFYNMYIHVLVTPFQLSNLFSLQIVNIRRIRCLTQLGYHSRFNLLDVKVEKYYVSKNFIVRWSKDSCRYQ